MRTGWNWGLIVALALCAAFWTLVVGFAMRWAT